jgi:hypothetical protein
MTLTEQLISDIPKLSPDEQRFVRYILDRVLIVGRRTYTPWVAANEKRDMADEAAQEAADHVVYIAMDAVLKADERAQRRACTHADRVWHAMVGEDGFGVVTERVGLPEPTATFDVIDGEVLEVAR